MGTTTVVGTTVGQRRGSVPPLRGKQAGAAADALSRAGLLGTMPRSIADSVLSSLPALPERGLSATITIAEQAPACKQINDEPRVAAALPAALTVEQETRLTEALPLVRFVARGIHDRLPAHIELDELISAGTLGLVDAARKYNPSKNVQFRSYAQFRIRGAILDSLRTLDWSPRELRRKGRALQGRAPGSGGATGPRRDRG